MKDIALTDEYGLTPAQRTFADEYHLTKNKQASAIKAGQRVASAGPQAARWLKNANVLAYLAKRAAKTEVVLQEKFEVDQFRILKELAAIALFDPATMYDENDMLLPISKMPEMTRRALAAFDVQEVTDNEGTLLGIMKKVKLHSKIAALELLGRNLAMWGDKDSGGLNILNIQINTATNQLDNPPQPAQPIFDQ